MLSRSVLVLLSHRLFSSGADQIRVVLVSGGLALRFYPRPLDLGGGGVRGQLPVALLWWSLLLGQGVFELLRYDSLLALFVVVLQVAARVHVLVC